MIVLAAIAGCRDQDEVASLTPPSASMVPTDLQDDLWHAHRHVHDNVQVHDHEHAAGFLGGHEHPHGHTHRHADTPLGGVVVSLQRHATPGQLPGNSRIIPPRPHLEILPGLPTELSFCLLSEELPPNPDSFLPSPTHSNVDGTQPSADTTKEAFPPDKTQGWSYWSPDLPTITIQFQLEGTEYTLICPRRKEIAGERKNFHQHIFSSKLPEALRERLASTEARLRVAKLTVELGQTRFGVREQIYFQGEELSVFLQ